MREGGSPMWVHTARVRRHREGPLDDAADQPRPRRLRRSISARVPGPPGNTNTLPSVVAEPVDGDGPRIVAVHAVAPIRWELRNWRSDLDWLAEQCAGDERDHGRRLQRDRRPLRRSRRRRRRPRSVPGCRGRRRCRRARHLADRRAASCSAARSTTCSRRPAGTVDAFRVVDELDGAGSDHRPVVATLARLTRGLARTGARCENGRHGQHERHLHHDRAPGLRGVRSQREPLDHAGLRGLQGVHRQRLGRARRDAAARPRAGRRSPRPGAPTVSAAFTGQRLIVPAGDMKQRANDTDYPFRAHSAFAHLTGWGSDSEPGAVLVFEPTGDGHDATVYFRERAGRDSEEFYANPAIGEFWIGAAPVARARRRRPRRRRRAASTSSTTSSTPSTRRRSCCARPTPSVTERVDHARIRFAAEQALSTNASDAPFSLEVGAEHEPDAELARVLSELRLVKDELRDRRDARRDRRDRSAASPRCIERAAAHHRRGARRARHRGRLRHPRPARRQRRRLRLDRRGRPARHDPALDPQRRPRRARRPRAARRRRRARQLLHRRHHPHVPGERHVLRGAAPASTRPCSRPRTPRSPS